MRHSLQALVALFFVALMACQSTVGSGRPCDTDSDCGAELCGLPSASAEPLTYAQLRCGSARGPGLAGTACQHDDDCDHGLCTVGGGCVSPCLSDQDCEADATCRDAFVSAFGEALRVLACLPVAAVGAGVEVQSVRLDGALVQGEGALPLAPARGPTVYVIEHMDDDAFPFSKVCRPPLCPRSLTTLGPEPMTLFDLQARSSENSTPISTSPFTFPLTVYVGNNPNPIFSSTGYQLTVAAEVSGDARVTRLAGEPGTGRMLDLNIYYAGTSLEPGAEGELPKPMATALAQLWDIFAQADIEPGNVSQHVIPNSILSRGLVFEDGSDPRAGFSVVKRGYGVWPELPSLFTLSSGIPNAGINLFLTADIEGIGPGEILAVSGGTPGPLGMQGTPASGIAVATDMLLGDPQVLGRTLAHEIGHYLGLFHTSETDGESHDPLPDTAECATEQDGNGDGKLTLDECDGHGADNLMFWANGAGDRLTTEQATILRRALILR